MKQHINSSFTLVIIGLLLQVSLPSSAQSNSGSCGPNAFWQYNASTKTLTISGSGPMNSYNHMNEKERPWLQFASDTYHINITNGITTIGAYAFYFEFSNVTDITIAPSVTHIGEGAIGFMDKISSIWIPYSVTSIDYQNFGYCDHLTQINVDKNNPVYCSIDGVVFSKDKKTLVKFPPGRKGTYTFPQTTVSIASHAFYTSELSSLLIPNHIKNIESFAFCASKLETVVLPNSITNINEGVFYLCKSLINITIPNSVKRVLTSAFHGCEKLMSVNIDSASSEVQIASDAFDEHTNLHFIRKSSQKPTPKPTEQKIPLTK